MSANSKPAAVGAISADVRAATVSRNFLTCPSTGAKSKKMASISKIKPGQTLYDVKRTTGLAAFRRKWEVWPVAVDEVNIEGGYIVARWNIYNPPRKMYYDSIKKLRVSPPK